MNEVKEEQIKKLNNVLHNIYKNFKKLNANVEAELFEGITGTELSIIGTIGNTPGVKMKDICERLQLPASTLTNVIDRLERRDLLKRVMSKQDRRSFVLELTQAGVVVYDKHKNAEKIIFETILGALEDDKEREAFIDSLEKISNGM